MASDRHTLLAGTLGAVILAAIIAGISITGGPGKARKLKEDALRLDAVSDAARALACYFQAKGDIPEDMSIVDAELAIANADVHTPENCWDSKGATDPVSGEPFGLRREGGTVTHICAVFATGNSGDNGYHHLVTRAVPSLYEPRKSGGEHCFGINLNAKLD
ncbi:MAG: hypothetical protein KJ833_01970 [Alphaproteobacteria bacterium]|nr:hypothetical protein [Alphaproteobacteria bacterium]